MSTAAARPVADTVVIYVDDRSRAFAAVRFLSDLTKRGAAPEFRRMRGARAWELRLPRPPVDRIEYQLELVRRDGGSEIACDLGNPLRVPGPFGHRSVLELEGYEAPLWLEDEEAPRGSLEPFSIPVRSLRTDFEGLIWTAPNAEPGQPLPLLVALDGPEYAEYSELARFLDSASAELDLPPLRAALVAPVFGERDEHFSASARYARAFATEFLPGLGEVAPSPPDREARIGMGASLGGLTMLHLHRLHPESFGGLFLQSGSYFRRRFDQYESAFPRFDRIARFVGRVLNAPEWPDPVPVTITCGTGEENLRNNRAVAEALRVQGYPVRLVEHADAHNWVSWRDTFDPHLVELVHRVWA